MALDPSIYSAFARRPKSVLEYEREAADVDLARQQRGQNALSLLAGQQKLDEYQRGVERGNALQRLRSGLAGKSEDDVIAAHRDAGFYDEAAGMEEGLLKRRKTKAEIGEKEAQTGKEKALATKAFGEAQADALKRYRGALDFIDTPDGAARWLQAQYQDPAVAAHMAALGPFEEAASRIPRDAQGFALWRQQAALGMEKWLEHQRGKNSSPLGKLIGERDALPAGDPRRRLYDDAITKETTRQAPMSLTVGLQAPTAAIDPVTGQPVLVQPANKPGAQPQVLRDPATGKPFGAPKTGQGDKLPAELQRMAIAMDALESGLTAYENQLKQFNVRSFDQLSPTQRAAIDSLVADLRMQAKEAQALGALSGPDMGILDRSLADPGSFKGLMYGNKGLTEQIKQTRAAIGRRRQALNSQRGGTPAASPSLAAPELPSADAVAAELERRRRAEGGR